MSTPYETDAVQPEAHEQLGFEDLTLFTGTFYRDDPSSRLRQELALQQFERAEALGIRMIVSDGGSNVDFLEAASQFPNVTLLQEPEGSTMGSSRRFALEEALADSEDDPDHIFMWIEPEKVDLVDPDTLTELVQPIREGVADIVVPSRKDLSTLPKQQAWFEVRANQRAGDLMKGQKSTLDLWFGPKVFNRRAAEYFRNYKGQLDKWDAIIKPVLEANNAGLKVIDVPVDFSYPPGQSQQEDGNPAFQRKRVEQYATILAELGDKFWLTHWAALRNGNQPNKPGSEN